MRRRSRARGRWPGACARKRRRPLDEASDDAAADDDATAAAEEAAAAAAAAEAARARAAGGGGSVDIEVDAALLVAVAVSEGRAECGGAWGLCRGTKPIEGEAKGVVEQRRRCVNRGRLCCSVGSWGSHDIDGGEERLVLLLHDGRGRDGHRDDVEACSSTQLGEHWKNTFFRKASKKRENENPLFLISLELQRRRKNENTPRLGNSRNGKKGHVRFSLSLSLSLSVSVCVVLSVVGQN